MPVGFLTQEQRDGFGRYVDSPSREELERYFHLSDEDREAIQVLRGNHNRLGYAVLLTTAAGYMPPIFRTALAIVISPIRASAFA